MRAATALAAVLLWAIGAGATAQPPDPGQVVVQLLAFNDLHGRLEPPTGEDGLQGGASAGGAAYLAAHLRRAEATGGPSVVVGAGDLFGDSAPLSARFGESPSVEVLNALDLKVSALGNHELDDGPAVLFDTLEGRCTPAAACPHGVRPKARFHYLAGNVLRRDTGRRLFPATQIVEIAGVKIGFIGVTLHDAGDHLTPSVNRVLQFIDEARAANVAAANLEGRGVHAIVLLIHQGGHQAGDPKHTDPNACDGFDGDLRPILARLSASIGVVISGHTHRAYVCEIAGHEVTSAGSYGRLLTHIRLTIDRANGQIKAADAQNEVVTRDIAPDPAVTAVLKRYQADDAALGSH